MALQMPALLCENLRASSVSTPTPYTLHPELRPSSASTPTPYTLHPTPYTLHPEPARLVPMMHLHSLFLLCHNNTLARTHTLQHSSA